MVELSRNIIGIQGVRCETCSKLPYSTSRCERRTVARAVLQERLLLDNEQLRKVVVALTSMISDSFELSLPLHGQMRVFTNRPKHHNRACHVVKGDEGVVCFTSFHSLESGIKYVQHRAEEE